MPKTQHQVYNEGESVQLRYSKIETLETDKAQHDSQTLHNSNRSKNFAKNKTLSKESLNSVEKENGAKYEFQFHITTKDNSKRRLQSKGLSA